MAVIGKSAERLSARRARCSVWTRSSSRIKWSSSEVGESLRAMAFCEATSRIDAAWWRPRARRASASDRVAARSLLAVIAGIGIGIGIWGGGLWVPFEERIVGLHGV